MVLYHQAEQEFEVVAEGPGAEVKPRLSPDERYLAYARDITSGGGGERRLEIRDLQTGANYPVSPQDAQVSRWSPDGSGVVMPPTTPPSSSGFSDR